jgi:hypothetical protein
MGQRGRTLYFTIEPSILGSLQWVFFLFWGWTNQMAHHEKEELNFGGASSNE